MKKNYAIANKKSCKQPLKTCILLYFSTYRFLRKIHGPKNSIVAYNCYIWNQHQKKSGYRLVPNQKPKRKNSWCQIWNQNHFFICHSVLYTLQCSKLELNTCYYRNVEWRWVVLWSGVEWNEVQWSVMGWSGMEWSGVMAWRICRICNGCYLWAIKGDSR